jgi:hypothetical protein
MAIQFGNSTVNGRSTQKWVFQTPAAPGTMPIVTVMPLSPSFSDANEFIFSQVGGFFEDCFPVVQQLGTSALWTKLSDDGSTLLYFLLVINFSDNPVEYAFLLSWA